MIPLLHSLTAFALALCLLAYRAADTHHRPRASLLAWLLCVAAAAVGLFWLFGRPAEAALAQLFINLVLLAALLAQDGNVLGLFCQPDTPAGRLARLLRGE